MGLDLRQRAPKVPIFVIACRIMLVNDKVCIPARQVSFAVIAGIVMLMEIQAFDGTHRLGPDGRGYLRVASLRMGVFRNLTRSLFHGNGGMNQCVDRAEQMCIRDRYNTLDFPTENRVPRNRRFLWILPVKGEHYPL